MTAIVYTASANMPQSCKGHYRRVYVIDVAPELAAQAIVKQPPIYQTIEGGRYPKPPQGWRPSSVRDKSVRKVLRDYGPQSVGSTDKCAYRRIVAEAEQWARDFNQYNGDNDAQVPA